MSLRHLFTFVVAATALASCIGNDGKVANNKPNPETQQAFTDSANFTTIEWIDSVKNFGKMLEGPNLDIVFRFKNTGNKPLIISDVRPGCGCTVAEKPTKPIMPGNEGEIKAQFESRGRVGVNNKNITVMANTKPLQSFELKFSVEVEKKG